MTDRTALLQAAEILETEAAAIHQAHTRADGSWCLLDAADRRAKADHDDMLRTAANLRRERD